MSRPGKHGQVSPATRKKAKPQKRPRPSEVYKKASCLEIQWSKTTVDSRGDPVCPSCGKPAEMIIGLFGACWAHT